MKKILFCLLYFPFLVSANSNLTESDISTYLTDICKSTPYYFTKKMNGLIMKDNSESSIGKVSRADIDRYKLIEKYKNLSDDSFKSYSTLIDMTGEINFNNTRSETRIAGICSVLIAQDDIMDVNASYMMVHGDGGSKLPDVIMKTVLNKNVNELKPLLEKIKNLD